MSVKAVGKPSMMPHTDQPEHHEAQMPIRSDVPGMSTITGMMISAISEKPK